MLDPVRTPGPEYDTVGTGVWVGEVVAVGGAKVAVGGAEVAAGGIEVAGGTTAGEVGEAVGVGLGSVCCTSVEVGKRGAGALEVGDTP